MRIFALAAAACLLSSSAFASGGLSCSAEDDKVSIDIESGVTRGMGSPVFNFRGRVEIRDASVAEDLRGLDFDQMHLPQYWLDGESLNLHLYREREAGKPHGYVDLVILTEAGEENSYSGSYVISVYDMAGRGDSGEAKTASIEGTVECFVE